MKELFLFFKKIFEGYKRGKKINKHKIFDYEEKFMNIITPFQNYDRKFLLVLSLHTLLKYLPKNFLSFLTYLRKELEDRSDYYLFKDILKNPQYYIQKDIDFLTSNYSSITEEEINYLFNKNKINFLTYYILMKNSNSNIAKEYIKVIDYILQYVKIKLDYNIPLIIEKEEIF